MAMLPCVACPGLGRVQGRVVQPIAGLPVPSHRLSGHGRVWVDFSCCSMPHAAFLAALAFELALRDPGSEKR